MVERNKEVRLFHHVHFVNEWKEKQIEVSEGSNLLENQRSGAVSTVSSIHLNHRFATFRIRASLTNSATRTKQSLLPISTQAVRISPNQPDNPPFKVMGVRSFPKPKVGASSPVSRSILSPTAESCGGADLGPDERNSPYLGSLEWRFRSLFVGMRIHVGISLRRLDNRHPASRYQ